MRNRVFGPVCVLITILFSTFVYPMLPEQLPTHWGINGEVDGYSPRLVGVAIAPLIGLVLVVLKEVLPRIDPHRARYSSFRGTYELIFNLIVLFLFVLQVAILGYALGWPISVVGVIQVSVGVLFVALGNELARVQPNWFMGIRTPWTLANEEVWRRTHRVSGRLLVVVGIVLALIVPFLPGLAAFVTTMTLVLGFAIFSIAYSYLMWRRVV